MSWSYMKTGRASTLAAVVQQGFKDAAHCPPGTAEEAARNALGAVAEALCKGFRDDPVVSISACGSAWTEGTKALQQHASFEFKTIADFVE